jgi:hypothetical protein
VDAAERGWLVAPKRAHQIAVPGKKRIGTKTGIENRHIFEIAYLFRLCAIPARDG